MDNFAILLSVVGNGLGEPYLSEDDIKSFDYDTYFDEENEAD